MSLRQFKHLFTSLFLGIIPHLIGFRFPKHSVRLKCSSIEYEVYVTL